MDWWTKYIGIPFEEKGRTALGSDCWGLIKLVFWIEREIELPSLDEFYVSTNDKKVLPAIIEMEKQRWITPDYPDSFDAIILNMRGVPMHVGIVTKPGYMLHCSQGIGTAHVSYNSMQWKNKIAGFARYE